MSTNLKVEPIKPFGPTILKITIPPDIIKKANDFADTQENKTNMDHRLVSRIEDVPKLTDEDMESLGLKDMFLQIGLHYVESITTIKPYDIKITSAWINNQTEDEYNPIHFHKNGKLSAVWYLKIPENKDRGFINDIDGNIDFVYGTSDYHSLYLGNFCYSPTEGDLLIFPSNLLHTVYPFKGKGLRRTVALNLDYILSKEEKK